MRFRLRQTVGVYGEHDHKVERARARQKSAHEDDVSRSRLLCDAHVHADQQQREAAEDRRR